VLQATVGAITGTLGAFKKQLDGRDAQARTPPPGANTHFLLSLTPAPYNTYPQARKSNNESNQLRQMIEALNRKVDRLAEEDKKNKAELARSQDSSRESKDDMVKVDEKMHRFRTELIKKWESEEMVRRREDESVKNAAMQHAKEVLMLNPLAFVRWRLAFSSLPPVAEPPSPLSRRFGTRLRRKSRLRSRRSTK